MVEAERQLLCINFIFNQDKCLGNLFFLIIVYYKRDVFMQLFRIFYINIFLYEWTNSSFMHEGKNMQNFFFFYLQDFFFLLCYQHIGCLKAAGRKLSCATKSYSRKPLISCKSKDYLASKDLICVS